MLERLHLHLCENDLERLTAEFSELQLIAGNELQVCRLQAGSRWPINQGEKMNVWLSPRLYLFIYFLLFDCKWSKLWLVSSL